MERQSKELGQPETTGVSQILMMKIIFRRQSVLLLMMEVFSLLLTQGHHR
jgi:hypothetical protein